MAPSAKTSSSKGLVTLKISPAKLRDIFPQTSSETPDDSTKDDIKASPAASVAAPNSTAEQASDSNAATPGGDGTPGPSAMGPPDGRKKGVKRTAAAALGPDGLPKPRGKPGPKKKPRLEDGTIDHAAVRAAAAAKPGPRANQGAINAGLRALDRSGKPCRKWTKGGFTLKTFTGVVWEIPRWTAPPKKSDGDEGDSNNGGSADGSNKENKDDIKDENSASASNAGGDLDMQSAHASSPAPVSVAAA